MIRHAQHEDVPQMVAMLKRCFDEMDFQSRGYSFNPASCVVTLRNVIDGSGFILVNDAITAIFGAFKVPSFMNHEDIKMVEFIFHTDPLLNDYQRAKYSRQLVKAAEAETKKHGVNRLHISAAINGQDASMFLYRLGYQAHEISLSKGV